MSKAVAIRDAGQHYASAPLAERQKYALTLASAYGLLPPSLRGADQHETAARFMLVAETGAMLGVHPLAAVTGIHVIDGKPTLSPGLMSGIVRSAGHKIRVRVSGEGDSLQAKATLIRSDDPEYPFEATWTMDRAKRAGLAGKGAWAKYPEAMLKARAIAEVCREGAEDVLMGVRYVPEELDAAVDETGEVIDEQPAQTPQGVRQEVVEDAVVEPAPREPEPPVWAPEKVDEFLLAVQASQSVPALGELYGEAKLAGALEMKVDQQGTTIENLIWQRRHEIENPRPAAAAPEPEEEVSSEPTDYDDDDPRAKIAEANRRAEQAGPESVPMVLDVDGGAS